MFSLVPKKVDRHCPACSGVVSPSQSDGLRYIFAYLPFRCPNCDATFETNNISKLLMLLMALAVTFLAIKIEWLREIQKTEPNLENYLLGGTFIVTCFVAMITIRFRGYILRDGLQPVMALLHYATLIAMPFSLLFFAYMAKLHGP